MYILMFILITTAYNTTNTAAHDVTMLPFKLGTHMFDQQIEQEYQLHVCNRLKKLRQQYPNHHIVNFFKQLTTTSLNKLIQQKELFDKAESVYTSIQTCPMVTSHFHQAVNNRSKHKDPAAWDQFRTTARIHLQKFKNTELPPLDLSSDNEPTKEQMNTYKTWLILYFAIKQNECYEINETLD